MPKALFHSRPIFAAIVLGLASITPLAGCDNAEARLDIIYSGVARNGRAATFGNLKREFDAGNITFESAMIRAEEMLQAGDADAVAFAGAVLDLSEAIEDKFPTGGEFELFWRRLGRLAYTSAHAAFEAGDYETGSMLVLAGPDRWKRDPYWIAYPNHEILVALAMAYEGNARGGIALLSQRTPQPDEYKEAIQTIAEIQRRQQQARDRAAENEAESESESEEGG